VAEAPADAVVAVYGFDGSDVCRKARNWLDRFGPAYRFVDVQRERPDAAMLKSWAATLDGWAALVDRGSRAWSGLLPQRRHPSSDPEWTLLIREHPGVLRQPIAVLPDGRLVAGFSGGSYEKLFGKRAASE
jgi:Spx/MgsR family transcriptional regulator